MVDTSISKNFNCTVKDIFRRPLMILYTVRSFNAYGYTEYSELYSKIRDFQQDALKYVSENMDESEYNSVVEYLVNRHTEAEVAEITYYNVRTVRRQVVRACELIRKYYKDYCGIILLENRVRSVKSILSPGTMWDKFDSLMCDSVENACIAIAYFNDKLSINGVIKNFNMGADKVKRIIDTYNGVATIYALPSEIKRDAI